jgi:hypothetical protein
MFFLLDLEYNVVKIRTNDPTYLVTWWLISVGPGGSSLEMLLASVASARTSHQSRKSFRRVQT